MEYSINIRRVIIIIEDVVFTGTYESLPFSLGTAVQLPSENVDPEMCSLEGARLFCRENTHKRNLDGDIEQTIKQKSGRRSLLSLRHSWNPHSKDWSPRAV